MTEELEKYEKSLKKKHSVSWSPKFEREVRTTLPQKVFVPVVLQVFDELEWVLVHQEETLAEARNKPKWGSSTEKISVQFAHGKVTVKSESLGNGMWDNGRNSKRVNLFIYALEQAEKGYDRESLAELEAEVESARNWDDYEVPQSLPQPVERRAPSFAFPLLGGVVGAILVAILLAYVSVKALYIIGFFEIAVAYVLVFIIKQSIRLGNYTFHPRLNHLLIAVIALTYILNQYFQYQLIVGAHGEMYFGFLDFMTERLHGGLRIKSIDTGWIGLVISWVFQLGFTYVFASVLLVSGIFKYQMDRVPMDVVDFAFYHFVKEKTEYEVRQELAAKGWKSSQHQDEVMESIAAIHGSVELSRQ